MTHSKRKFAIALAGTLALSAAGTATAAPVGTNTAAVKAAAPSEVTDVRWYGRGWGWGGPGPVFGGLALGLAGAAVLGAPYWGYGYPGYYGYAYNPYPYGYYGYAASPYPYWGWRRHHYRRWYRHW
jgi:hypothetical protein